ncbi:hypothetical protein AtubIFM55763_002012 [Aspergillus tubingensis]|uniref:Programmed cell death protein 2 C-terminal domain-containing protein n=2 Tax=Aspergillus subgen. Circumdati TaxID=2720871 RepID=A0A1L9N392_ASPTC|nr:PDCD2 domain containing protein [Aspergillus tubingensis]OJI83766.1 hypothetical protein ASPTUDRAFT_190211 [Aspergillus tubingensis CBS 134.48]GAQ43149.1 PDCD2_C domain protein [Aspergillus niger]GFN19771.1 PDCD2_C domain protein [Aspergillus tubingensis]GLA61085.1 hypothetical protein AtubIFM54640_001594 [Aspergillus tubingensis]GLA71571.1 hypothetical protein AtubIFM55763_002012 [Aspergillus tubingensis]
MDPYDSDSSFDDEGDFSETNVLLGYAADEIVEDTISHLGGWPTWLDDATPPPGDFAKCKVCNQPMLLLLELHGDLPNDFPDDERRLYIFSCPRKACNRKPGSIRALRAVRKLKIEPQHQPPRQKEEQKPEPSNEEKKEEEEKKPAAPKPDLGASLFGSSTLTGSVSASANPFSAGASSTSTNNNPFAAPAPSPGLAAKPTPSPAPTLSESFADKVRISSPQQQQPKTNLIPPPEASTTPNTPWPAQSDFPTPYTNFYLDAEYEAMSRPSTPTIPANVTIDNTEEEGPNGGAAELKDTFESELDKAFIRFSTRLGHNPEQVLRYEFRGTPLLYSYADAVGKRLHDPSKTANPNAKVTTVGGGSRMPRCEYCGSERVFELQLVPHVISVLEDGREGVGLGPKDDAGMEWGTIILGVCGKDCGPKEVGVVGYREEWAGVQWEEQAK